MVWFNGVQSVLSDLWVWVCWRLWWCTYLCIRWTERWFGVCLFDDIMWRCFWLVWVCFLLYYWWFICWMWTMLVYYWLCKKSWKLVLNIRLWDYLFDVEVSFKCYCVVRWVYEWVYSSVFGYSRVGVVLNCYFIELFWFGFVVVWDDDFIFEYHRFYMFG